MKENELHHHLPPSHVCIHVLPANPPCRSVCLMCGVPGLLKHCRSCNSGHLRSCRSLPLFDDDDDADDFPDCPGRQNPLCLRAIDQLGALGHVALLINISLRLLCPHSKSSPLSTQLLSCMVRECSFFKKPICCTERRGPNHDTIVVR